MTRAAVSLLALLAAGCGSGGGGNAGKAPSAPVANVAGPVAAAPDALAAFAVDLSLDGGVCRATVAGEAVGGPVLLERAVDALRRSVDLQGGIDRVDALPAALIRGPDVPWRCAAAAIFTVQRAGFAEIRFEAEASGAPVVFALPVEDPNVPPMPIAPSVNRVAVMADGALRWNGATIASAELSERLAATRSVRPTPVLEIDPAADARLAAGVGLLAQIRGAGISIGGERPDGRPSEETPVAGDLPPPPVVSPGQSPAFGFVVLDRYAGALK